MSKKKQKTELFTEREILSILNNAVMFTGSPAAGVIPDERKRRLRDYAQAIIEPTLEHVEEELLSAQELAHVLAAAALYVFIRYVSDTDKVPGSPAAKAIYE